jgi:uncharacterized membrane protein
MVRPVGGVSPSSSVISDGLAVQVLPEGAGFPPLPYLLVLTIGVAVVAGLLVHERPEITATTVLGLAPWMVAGAALHALFQLGAAPEPVVPLLGTPAVYFATFVPAGLVWVLAVRTRPERVPRTLAVAGTAVALPAAIAVLASAGRVRPGLSLASVVIAVVLTGGCWAGLARVSPEAVTTTGSAGLLVVFAHALDGASTAVGVDLLGAGERTPLSAAILEFAGTLPTAGSLGVGWLFVLVKLALAVAVVQLFAGYVREAPSRAYLFLTVIVAVGLGPGAQNVLLFAVV